MLAGAAALVLFIGAGLISAHKYHSQLAASETTVASAHAELAAARTAAAAESAWATSLSVLAASQAVAAERVAAHAAALTDTVGIYRAKFLAAAKIAPDTCIYITQYASTLVQSVDAVNSALRVELDTTRASRDSYQASADSSRAALATLSVPVSRLDTAATTLAKASKEPFLSRIAPKPFIGAFAGVTSTGSLTTAIGFGFGWKL